VSIRDELRRVPRTLPNTRPVAGFDTHA